MDEGEEEERKRGMKEEAEAVDTSMRKVKHKVMVMSGKGGVGKTTVAANLAFASLPGVTLPSDISATDRYFDEDVTEPAFYLGPASTITLPQGMGIAVEVQRERLQGAKARWASTNPPL